MSLPEPIRRNLLLLVVCLAQLMVILDVSIVNVALPSIHDDLGYTTTGLQWVVNAYTLTFAGFLLLGGRFLSGLITFTAASVLCAVADTQGTLDAARALQGFGAAVISPASLAILTTSFAEGRERNRALGVWGAMGAIGGSTGALLGGLLTQDIGWPAIFLINVPIGIGVIAASLRLVPEGRSEAEHRHFDATGAILVTVGLVALVYGIVRTDALGWGSAGVLLPLAAGLILIAAFAFVEARVAQVPLLPARIVRMGRLRAALETGVGFLPMTLSIVAVTSFTARLIARFGAGWVLTAGLLFGGAGMALLSDVHAGGSYFADVLPGGVLSAIGLGLGFVSGTIVAVQGIEGRDSGLASGLLNASRLLGGALGLAALSTLAASHTSDELASGTQPAAALSDGFHVAFLAGAGICLAGAVVSLLLLRRPAAAPASAPEPESA